MRINDKIQMIARPWRVQIFAELFARATLAKPGARKSRFYAGLNFAKIRLATHHPRIPRFKVVLPRRIYPSCEVAVAMRFCFANLRSPSPVRSWRTPDNCSGVYACYADRRLYSAITNVHDFTVDRIRRIMHIGCRKRK